MNDAAQQLPGGFQTLALQIIFLACLAVRDVTQHTIAAQGGCSGNAEAAFNPSYSAIGADDPVFGRDHISRGFGARDRGKEIVPVFRVHQPEGVSRRCPDGERIEALYAVSSLVPVLVIGTAAPEAHFAGVERQQQPLPAFNETQFESLPLRNIEHHAMVACCTSPDSDPPALLHPADDVSGQQEPVLQRKIAAIIAGGLYARLHLRAVIGMDARDPCLARGLDLSRNIFEQPEHALVPEIVPGLEILLPDAEVSRIHGELQPFLRCDQAVLLQLPVRDVGGEAVADRRSGCGVPAPAPSVAQPSLTAIGKDAVYQFRSPAFAHHVPQVSFG